MKKPYWLKPDRVDSTGRPIHSFTIPYRSLGEQNRRFPLTGIQAQHPAPAPHASHARHDRSMARNRLVARPMSGVFVVRSVPLASNVQSAKRFTLRPNNSVLNLKLGFHLMPQHARGLFFCHTSNEKCCGMIFLFIRITKY